MKFEWDPVKAASNAKKHKVTFEMAKTVFYDDFAVQFFDEEHSRNEERFLLLGMSSDARLLLVCHCEKEDGECHSNHLCSQSNPERSPALPR